VLSLPNTVTSNEKPPIQTSNPPMQPPSRPLMRSGSAGSNHSRQPHTPNQQPPSRNISNSFSGAQINAPNSNSRPQPQQFNQNKPQVAQTHQNTATGQHQAAAPQPPGPTNTTIPAEGVGFFSARAVKHLPEEAIATGHIAPKAGQVFNPKAESPSIRKTPGIDHTKSKPLARNGQHVAPVKSDDVPPSVAGASPGVKAMPRPGPPMVRGNVVNPQLDQARRIGAPGVSSPLANRGQYRPPTMKRPSGGDTVLSPGGRTPLADLSNDAPANAGGDGTSGPDFKRQRMG